MRFFSKHLDGTAGSMRRDRRGNAAAILAASLPVVVGAMGLGVDFTSWVMYKRTLQGAADAAALAGATTRAAGGDLAAVTAEAEKVANGNSTVTRNLTSIGFVASPHEATGTTNGSSVEVVLHAPGRLYFAGLFMSAAPSIRVRAVAGPRGQGTACFLALGVSPSYNNADALEIKDATVNAAGCGFHSNSSHASQALRDHGNGSFTGLKVSAVGGVSGISGTPTQSNAPAMTDPYGASGRNLQLPSGTVEVERCPGKDCPLVNGVRTITPPASGQCIRNNDGDNFTINQDVTWAPGVYLFCANQNNGQANVLKLDDGDMTGAGVSIVLRDGMRMEVNGNVNLNLQAMTTAQAANLYPSDAARRALAGILFWQVHESDPTDKPNFITGNTTTPNLRGAFYSPHSGFEMRGNLGAQGCMQLVAERVLLDGNATLNNNCAALTGNDAAFTHFGTPGQIVLAE